MESDGVRYLLSSETQGQSFGSGEKAARTFSSRAKELLGTDSHRTISKNSSGCRLLIGHKKCFVLLCPIGEQFLLSSSSALVRAIKRALKWLIFFPASKTKFRISCVLIKQIGLPLRGGPILLITRIIKDRIGLHSVLLPLLN